MPPGCFLSKLFYTIFSPFLPPLPSHRHCAPLHNHHHHHYHQFHRRHFLFTFTTTFFVSRFLIKAILATLFLISIPDIRFLFFPTLPTSSLFFCEAHLLPPHSNGGTIVNGSFALPPPLLPFSPLTPSVIISSQAAKAIDDKPIADFEVRLFLLLLCYQLIFKILFRAFSNASTASVVVNCVRPHYSLPHTMCHWSYSNRSPRLFANKVR